MSPWTGLFLISLVSFMMTALIFYAVGQRLFDYSAGGRFLLAFLMATLHLVLPGIYLTNHHLPLTDLVAAAEFLPPLAIFWRLAYTQASRKPILR